METPDFPHRAVPVIGAFVAGNFPATVIPSSTSRPAAAPRRCVGGARETATKVHASRILRVILHPRPPLPPLPALLTSPSQPRAFHFPGKEIVGTFSAPLTLAAARPGERCLVAAILLRRVFAVSATSHLCIGCKLNCILVLQCC